MPDRWDDDAFGHPRRYGPHPLGGVGGGRRRFSRAGLSGSEWAPNLRGVGPKGWRRSDERVREDVCEALADAWDVDPSDLEVEVRDGEVTLTGTVHSRWEKRRAEDIAESIAGVVEVHNRIRRRRPGSELPRRPDLPEA